MLKWSAALGGAVAGIVAICLLAAPRPAYGQYVNGGDPAPVQVEGAEISGELQTQVATLQSGSGGGGGSEAPSCTWLDRSGSGDPVERDDGAMRWRIAHQGQDYHQDLSGGDLDQGTRSSTVRS